MTESSATATAAVVTSTEIETETVPPPARMAAATNGKGPPGISADVVSNYLLRNPSFLESFVTSSAISKETFQRWTWRRDTHKNRQADAPVKVDDVLESAKLLDCFRNRNNMLYAFAATCAGLARSEKWELIVPNRENEEQLLSVVRENGVIKLRKARKHRREPHFVLPLTDPTGKKLGEIHFFSVVNDRDMTFCRILERWGTGCVYFAQLYRRHERQNSTTINDRVHTTPSPSPEDAEFIARQRKLNAFLLEVVRSIFQDIETTETVVRKVLSFAQSLVDADRASLFFVDNRNRELYSRIFDQSQSVVSESTADVQVSMSGDGVKEIRFSMDRGIAGYVARTGEGVNITSAYDDVRFNKEVDSKTGYHTSTILCMPIFVRKTVMGVMQMVNKRNGVFTQVDEEAFETFALYCGLALHHAKLYEKIRRSEFKHRVALEVLAYHGACSKEEVRKLKKVTISPEGMQLISNFDFNAASLGELEKPLYAVHMFDTLFRQHFSYNHDDLIRFVLTVRKNYRKVPYHNWAHGFTVAHAIFVVLKSTKIFRPIEALGLFIACICHDLDHRGKNNAYMKSMSTPLAAIYSTSVMERHHFNQAVTILQQDGNNVLQSLSREEYKEVLSLIKHCILATDLALFFPNKATLGDILKKGYFSWTDTRHRSLAQAILMTACDLIASAKPWSVQTETVKVICEEFYEQGDAERINGKTPLPMMDRTKANELPSMQVGFMKGICVECYELIAQVLPETSQLSERARQNLEKWAELDEEQKRKAAGKNKAIEAPA